jgi:hypothetical protein
MIQSFREKAERAERLARSINDQRTCDALLNYARECREKDAARLDLTEWRVGLRKVGHSR